MDVIAIAATSPVIPCSRQAVKVPQRQMAKPRSKRFSREDRERGYPTLIRDLLPVGLLGLAQVSLMAAFMSTVPSHIN